MILHGLGLSALWNLYWQCRLRSEYVRGWVCSSHSLWMSSSSGKWRDDSFVTIYMIFDSINYNINDHSSFNLLYKGHQDTYSEFRQLAISSILYSLRLYYSSQVCLPYLFSIQVQVGPRVLSSWRMVYKRLRWFWLGDLQYSNGCDSTKVLSFPNSIYCSLCFPKFLLRLIYSLFFVCLDVHQWTVLL